MTGKEKTVIQVSCTSSKEHSHHFSEMLSVLKFILNFVNTAPSGDRFRNHLPILADFFNNFH